MVRFTVKQEGKRGEWVVRRDGKAIVRSRHRWRCWDVASRRARDEAAREGVTCEVLADGGPIHAGALHVQPASSHTWTPEKARENIEAIREICRQALAPANPETFQTPD
jgi:hypothetical protein